MELHYYETLPSTNRTAAQAAREGAGELYTVIAREQTEGRGRMTRSFFSPVGGLYMSVVLRPRLPRAAYMQITPVAAVAVHRAIMSLTGTVTSIKWINDLLLEGKKVCGILAESGFDQKGEPFVILGIGVNAASVDFPPELRESATFVPCDDLTALAGAIVAELAEYERMIESGEWLSYYRHFCAWLGESVIVTKAGGSRNALALDVMPDGALQVLFEDGTIQALCDSEISLRPAPLD